MNIGQLDWQTITALAIVLAAIGFLARKTWKTIFGSASAGCGTSCNSCSTSEQPQSLKVTKLVQLDSATKEN